MNSEMSLMVQSASQVFISIYKYIYTSIYKIFPVRRALIWGTTKDAHKQHETQKPHTGHL